MTLQKVLDNLNSFEKNSFLKIIDALIANNPGNEKKIDVILSENNKDLKNIDNINIAKVFNLLEDEFTEYIKSEFVNTSSQLDILIDLISREGNSIMKYDWFARLYDKEINDFKGKLKNFHSKITSSKSDLSDERKRDYQIYRGCLETAYNNDLKNNQDRKITTDELSILIRLGKELGLSQEEVKLINYQILPVKKQPVDDVISELKNIGVIFYSKKNNTVFISDEMVRVLHKVRNKQVGDKYYRRVLKALREPQINLVSRSHGIDWKGIDIDIKIKNIINEGIPFDRVLSEDIFKEGTTLTEKKKFINELCDKELNIESKIKGTKLEEKIENLITYFDEEERDPRVGISLDGYDRMLMELGEDVPEIRDLLKKEFQFQEDDILKSSFLLDFNLKPRDVLELLTETKIRSFCEGRNIKSRGNIITNILENYKDAENLFLENYESIGFRDIEVLRDNGIKIKESNLGVKFEEITKVIFDGLGFHVDEDLRQSLNTKKDKADIILNMGHGQLIVVECKTSKNKGFDKFSSVSRQLKSYSKRINNNDYKVIKSLLVAPEFSDDFVKECGLEYELNLSLIKASTLMSIFDGFKESRLEKFPHNLLMRDVLIQEDRVLKALEK